jgi:hypothetical protein
MVAAFKQVGLNVRIVPEPLRPDTESVVESAPEIQPQPTPFVPTIPQAPLLNDYEEPQVVAAPVPAPITGPLSDEEILRRMSEIESAAPQISAEEFFDFKKIL